MAIVNKAAMNIGVQMFVQVPAFSSFEYIPKSGIVILCLIFFLRNHHIVYTASVPFSVDQQCTRVPFSLHPCQYLFFDSISFLIVAILMDGKWYIIVVSICIYTIIANGVEYLFSCTHWLFVHLLWTSVFKSFALKSVCLVLLLLSCRNSLYILSINPLSSTIWFANIFLIP